QAPGMEAAPPFTHRFQLSWLSGGRARKRDCWCYFQGSDTEAASPFTHGFQLCLLSRGRARKRECRNVQASGLEAGPSFTYRTHGSVGDFAAYLRGEVSGIGSTGGSPARRGVCCVRERDTENDLKPNA